MAKAKRGKPMKAKEAGSTVQTDETYVVGDSPQKLLDSALDSINTEEVKDNSSIMEEVLGMATEDTEGAETPRTAKEQHPQTEESEDGIEEEEEIEGNEMEDKSDEEQSDTEGSPPVSAKSKPSLKRGLDTKQRNSPSSTPVPAQPRSRKGTTSQSSSASIKEKRANLATVMKAKGRDTKTAAPKQKSVGATKKSLMLDKVLEGLAQLDERKGVSLVALRKYIMGGEDFSSKSWGRVREQVRNALDEGLMENYIVRPKGSEDMTGLTGFYKISKTGQSRLKAPKAKNPTATTKKNDPPVPEKKKLLLPDTSVKPKLGSKTTKSSAKSKPEPKKYRVLEWTKVDSEEDFELEGKMKPKSKLSKNAKANHPKSKSGELENTKKKKLTKTKSLEEIGPASKKAKAKKQVKKAN